MGALVLLLAASSGLISYLYMKYGVPCGSLVDGTLDVLESALHTPNPSGSGGDGQTARLHQGFSRAPLHQNLIY